MPNPLEDDSLEKEVIITDAPPYENPVPRKANPRTEEGKFHSVLGLAQLSEGELDRLYGRSREQIQPIPVRLGVKFKSTLRLAMSALSNH